MKEDETIGKYFLRVEELVNAMKALGEKIEEPSLVYKILRSLPDRFNPKVSAIEELNDLKTLEFDQLLGTLTAYGMRIVKDKPTSREASFKANKNEDSEPDEIEENFVKRLKKGSGKYKGKLPFKCFNYGKIGHFQINVLTKEMIRHLMMRRSTNTEISLKRIILRRKVFV
jgi:hypothetical protein